MRLQVSLAAALCNMNQICAGKQALATRLRPADLQAHGEHLTCHYSGTLQFLVRLSAINQVGGILGGPHTPAGEHGCTPVLS